MKMPKGLSLIEHDNKTLAQLYNTLIVETKPIEQGHHITLRTGGWWTKHTKKCMNLALEGFGVTITQKKGYWYAQLPNNTKIAVYDGITFTV